MDAGFDRGVTSGLGSCPSRRQSPAMTSTSGQGVSGRGSDPRAPGRRILDVANRAAPSPARRVHCCAGAGAGGRGEGGACCEHLPLLGVGKLFVTTYLGDEHEHAWTTGPGVRWKRRRPLHPPGGRCRHPDHLGPVYSAGRSNPGSQDVTINVRRCAIHGGDWVRLPLHGSAIRARPAVGCRIVIRHGNGFRGVRRGLGGRRGSRWRR